MTEGLLDGVDSHGVPYRIDGLRALSDDQLDAAIRLATHSLQAGDILAEVNRRAVERQTQQSITLTDEIRHLTSQIRWLTGAAIVLAVVSLAVAIVALLRPGG